MEELTPRRWTSLIRSYIRQGKWIPLAALLIVLAITATAALPLLWYGVSQAFDTPIHLARLGALDDALAQGELYPRWLPALLLGHGYPLFNYYAPAPYYLAEAFLLLGANASNAYAIA